MAIRKADLSRVTKTQLEALMTPVVVPDKLEVTEHIYQDYNTPGAFGNSYQSQRKLLFRKGQQITQADIDALFPTATFVSVTPALGAAAGGTPVTIKGTNLSGATGVTIGGVAATDFKLVNDTTITCTTGAHAAGKAAIVIADDKANVTANDAFTYRDAANATVTNISPDNGSVAGGTNVTLTGTNMNGTTGVTFGGVAATAVTVVGATSVTCTTGAHAVAGVVDVVLTDERGDVTVANGFTYKDAADLTATSITPDTGDAAGGTAVVIVGTNLNGLTGITFDGAAATDVEVVSATEVHCVTPAGSAGTADVVLTDERGSVTKAAFYTYA